MANKAMVKEKQPISGKKILNNIKTFFSKPSNIILVVFFVILCVGVIYPLAKMIIDSFIIQSPGEAANLSYLYDKWLETDSFTFLNWPALLANKKVEGYSRTYFWLPLIRSIGMAITACIVSVIAGGALAFFITRTNLPAKKFISAVFIFPYIMPSWSLAMFWENFFKNDAIAACNGKGLLQAITGICVPQSMVYGFFPTAMVMAIHYAPFAYILIGGILRNMDANLEEAATILGASRGKILRRITLPIVAPAMISTILLVFASSISSYTVPAFLCKTNPSYFFALTMRSSFSMNKSGEGYVMATVLLLFSIIILTINNWFTKSRRSFTTVSGKSGQISKINLKKAKWPIAVVLCIIVAFFAIFPMVTFFLESLERIPGQLNTITLDYWFSKTNTISDPWFESRGISTQGILVNKTVLASVGRSFIIAICISLICGTSGILIGYAVSKNRRSRFANLVSSMAFFPYLIPSLTFGVVFYSFIKTPAFSFLDVNRTGIELSAMAVVVICGGIKFLPFASRSGTNAMLQVSGEIEEAAIITGCPWGKRMTRILFPIQKASFISGYLLPFISSIREFTLFTLITSNFTLATNVMEYFNRNSASQIANGVNLLLVIIVLVVNFVVNKVTGASIDKGIGG